MALHGMRCLNDTEHVRQIVKVLAEKIVSCDKAFRARHIGMALYGMRHLGDTEEVRQLVTALGGHLMQPVSPAAHGCAYWQQYGVVTCTDLRPCCRKIRYENAPGHPVDDEVMRHDQETSRLDAGSARCRRRAAPAARPPSRGRAARPRGPRRPPRRSRPRAPRACPDPRRRAPWT